jgi:hypothetical protein
MASPGLKTPESGTLRKLVQLTEAEASAPEDQADVRFGDSTGWAGNSFGYRAPQPRDELSPDGFETLCDVPCSFDQRSVKVNTPIRLQAGRPPSVHLQSGRRIGEIGTGIRFLIEIRIEDGCCLTGFVSSIDPLGDTGALALACVSP